MVDKKFDSFMTNDEFIVSPHFGTPLAFKRSYNKAIGGESQ